MASSSFARWGRLASVAGGLLWVAVFALFALRPSGTGSAPPYRSFEGLCTYLACSPPRLSWRDWRRSTPA